MICLVLPIICLVNYLALSSKLKYILIPISCGGMIYTMNFIPGSSYLASFLLVLCSVVLLAYVIFVLKCICVKIRERKVKYVMIDGQHFDINEDSEDDNSNEL